jgi:hypothetical protein
MKAAFLGCVAIALALVAAERLAAQAGSRATPANHELHDPHFHLTNYIQEGTDLRKGNYERLFDDARRKVRAWEKAHVHSTNHQ